MPDDPITIIEAAIERLRDDVGAIVEPAVVAAFSILRATDLPNYLRLRHKAKEANKGCLVTELDKAVQQSLPGGGDEPSALDEPVTLAGNQCQFKHDADRIARAIGDLLLARADCSPQRFYSLSAQIQRERKAYYGILERTQKGTLDVTDWLAWFLETLHRAVDQAQQTIDAVLAKARFWQRFAGTPMNERQVKLLNRLLDSFEGKLTTSKWAAIAKCSPDTALRDINELLAHGVLRKAAAGGRSTHYELNESSADPVVVSAAPGAV